MQTPPANQQYVIKIYWNVKYKLFVMLLITDKDTIRCKYFGIEDAIFTSTKGIDIAGFMCMLFMQSVFTNSVYCYFNQSC